MSKLDPPRPLRERWKDKLKTHAFRSKASNSPSPAAAASSTPFFAAPVAEVPHLPPQSKTLPTSVVPIAQQPHSPSLPTRSNHISLDDVLAKLSEQERLIIKPYCQDTDFNIRAAVDSTLKAAETKMQQCVSNKWEVKVGNKTIALRDKIDKVVGLINKSRAIGTTIASIDPVHAGLPWAAVCAIFGIAVATQDQMQALTDGITVALSTKLSGDLYLELHAKQPAGLEADNLRKKLLSLYVEVFSFLAKALRLSQASRMSRLLHAITTGDDLPKFATDCRNALDDVERAARSCDRDLASQISAEVTEVRDMLDEIQDRLLEIQSATENIRIKLDLSKLPIATGAQFDSSGQDQKRKCLPGTRKALQETIWRWIDDPASESFFWLSGIAGEGKSTIAMTIAERLQRQKQLGASFCFERDHHERGDASMFFSTIASQLTRVIQGLDLLIAKLLDGEHGRYDVAPEYQFGDLIAAPLQTLSQTNPSSGTTIVIVVDALDECVEYQARKVVELLARLDQYPPFKIKTLLTSRPIEAIRSEFLRMEPSRLRRLALEDTSQDVLEGDISLFIHERLKDIRSRHERLGNDWPGQDKINELIIRSVPLFLYANTVCAFIDDDKVTPEEQLRAVLDESSGPQLAMTYLPILKAFTKGYSGTRLSKTQETLRNIIGPVVLAAEPLPLDLVLKLSALEDHNQLRARLTSLQSVLFISRTNTCDQAFVRPFHLTFRDFLVDPEEEHDFQIDQCSTHKHIAATCLEIMKAPGSLRRDICAQKVTGVKRLDVEAFAVNKHIKAHLAYACNHWAHHLEMSGSSLDDTHEALDFLRNNFLYWFEAMSWLDNASAMVRTIQALQMLTKVLYDPLVFP
jgi:hypothetical protein